MRILLWGSYNQGNFGDDAMAQVFSRQLVALGHTVTLGNATQRLADHLGLERCGLARSEASSIDATVIGGGGLLAREPWRWRLSSTRRAFDRELRRLAHFHAVSGIPMFAVSVGGDGAREGRELTKGRRQAFSSALLQGATARLMSDRELVGSLAGTDIPIHIYPDVLFSLGDGTGEPLELRDAIGVNLKRSTVDWVLKSFDEVGVHGRIVPLRTHTPESGHRYEVVDIAAPEDRFTYTSVEAMLRVLGSLRLLVTCKLHVALAAFAVGTPAICVAPAPKTRAQMAELGLENVAVNSAELTGLLRKFVTGEYSGILWPRPATWTAKKKESQGHLRSLESWLGSAAA